MGVRFLGWGYSLLLLSQALHFCSNEDCSPADACEEVEFHLTRLWYVWFLLALSLSLVACGGALRCVHCCARQGAEGGGRGSRPLEVTVITLEQDTIHSTMQNTISSIQSLFLPGSRRAFAVTRCQSPLPGGEVPPCRDSSPAAPT